MTGLPNRLRFSNRIDFLGIRNPSVWKLWTHKIQVGIGEKERKVDTNDYFKTVLENSWGFSICHHNWHLEYATARHLKYAFARHLVYLPLIALDQFDQIPNNLDLSNNKRCETTSKTLAKSSKFCWSFRCFYIPLFC